MPIGACDRCHCWFVVEDERSPQRTCPHCFHPMRLTTSAEAVDHLHGPAPTSPSARPTHLDAAGLSGAVLAANRLRERLLAAVAEAAALRSQAATCRQEARERRQRRAQSRHGRTWTIRSG